MNSTSKIRRPPFSLLVSFSFNTLSHCCFNHPFTVCRHFTPHVWASSWLKSRSIGQCHARNRARRRAKVMTVTMKRQSRRHVLVQRFKQEFAKSRNFSSYWRRYSHYATVFNLAFFVTCWTFNQIRLLSLVDPRVVLGKASDTDETRKWLSWTGKHPVIGHHQNLTCVQPLPRVNDRRFEILCTFETPDIHTLSETLYDPTGVCDSLSVKALNGLLSGGGSLEFECATRGTESNWLWHLHVTGTCPVIPIFSHHRLETNASHALPTVVIQDYSRESQVFNVCPRILRSTDRFLFFKLPQGFADQVISIASAIVLSRRHGFTLILPLHFLTPSSSMELAAEERKRVQLSALYDLTRLEHVLSNAGYTVILDLPTSKNGHLSWFKDPLGRQSGIREVDFCLFKYSKLDDIVVDIGDPLLDMLSLDDVLHTELFQVVQFLVSSFKPLIYSSVEHLRRTLATMNPKGYNALHLSTGNGTTQHCPSTKDLEGRWEEGLLPHKAFDVQQQLPLYIAHEKTGAHIQCQQFLCTDKSLLGDVAFFPEASREPLGIMAAIDMLLLVDAKNFAGPMCSTFSHLIVTLRHARNSFDIYDSAIPHPFEDMSDDLNRFGSLTPLPPRLRTRERIQALKSLATESQSKRQLAELRAKIERLGLSSPPSVFEMTYILELFETPGKEDLAIQTLLEFTGARHLDRLGEKLRLFLERDPLHKALFGRALCHRFPTIGKVTCKTVKSIKLLVVSHSLVSDGAPVVLTDYVLYLSRVLRLEMQIVTRAGTPEQTSLQLELEKANLPVSHNRTFDATGFDVILINTLDMWWYKGLSSKPKRERIANSDWASKTIWWVHESARDHFTAVHPYLPKVLRSVGHAIFTTPQSRDVYKDLLVRVPSTVIANPLDISVSREAQFRSIRSDYRSKEIRVKDSVTFILIGTVYPGRHQLEFVQAALRLLQSCPKSQNLSFVVVGFDGVAKEYETQVKVAVAEADEDVTKRFKLIPRSSHFDCLTMLSAADVLVSTSNFESFGMTLLEAMSMGKPVITSKVDGVPSVIYHEAIDVPLGDVPRLKEAMEAMLDEETRSLHAMQAIRHYEKFQTLDVRLKHIQVFADVVKKGQTVIRSPPPNARALKRNKKRRVEKPQTREKKRKTKI